jgi:hypothetical protein
MNSVEFIENIINTRGQWSEEVFNSDRGCEKHHIVPACKGGLGDYQDKNGKWKFKRKSHHFNCIYLYPSEHYEIHKKLYLENSLDVDLARAWLMMVFPKNNKKTKRTEITTPEDYELARIAARMALTGENSLFYGKDPWNKGLTKETDARIAQQAMKQKGINTWSKGLKRTEEQKERCRLSALKRSKEKPDSYVSGTKDKVAINNGVTITYISKDCELPDGYVYGQGKHHSYNIKNYDEFCKQKSEQVSGKNNPMYGKGYKLSGGKNGKAIYIYTFEGIDYYCRDDLMIILKDRWPTISESTIRNIQSGKYGKCISNKFKYVIDNLKWRLKKDEDKIN